MFDSVAEAKEATSCGGGVFAKGWTKIWDKNENEFLSKDGPGFGSEARSSTAKPVTPSSIANILQLSCGRGLVALASNTLKCILKDRFKAA